MIFAKHTGRVVKGAKLTKGKVYFVSPAVDGSETVGFEFFDVVDDIGVKYRARPDDKEFEFVDEVYAVVLSQSEFDLLEPGKVVVLNGVEADGITLRVKDIGLASATRFAVLDATTLYPGMKLLDLATGKVEDIRRVDECGWIVVDDQDKFRPPTDFAVPVADGEVLREALAECMDATGAELTVGRLYYVTFVSDGGMVSVVNDGGNAESFMFRRFKKGWFSSGLRSSQGNNGTESNSRRDENAG